MSADVLTNRDLVRHMIRHSSHATSLLATTKALRSQEDCANLFERWAATGCPTHTPTDPHEHQCLQDLGGGQGLFCQGSFHVHREGHPTTTLSSAQLARRLARRMQGDDRTLAVTFRSNAETVVIRMHHSAEHGNRILLTRDGWRRKGRRCHPSDAELTVLIRALLTQRGPLMLPCAGSSSEGTVHVPHLLSVQLLDGNEHVLTAQRGTPSTSDPRS